MRRINEDRYQQHGGGPLLSKLFDAAEFKLLHKCKIPENCKKGDWWEFVGSIGKYCCKKSQMRQKLKVFTANLWGLMKQRVHTAKTWRPEKLVGPRIFFIYIIHIHMLIAEY